MEIEKEIFKRAKVKKETLLPYGFKKEKEQYLYQKEFMGGSFRADIIIDKDGNLSGKVIDVAFGDEYRNFRIENQVGAFVGQVREEYSSILMDILAHCYSTLFFVGEQANRLCEKIHQAFGDKPEFLFDDPYSCIFRNPANQKWYGIIMSIGRNRIYEGEEGEIEIINLKLDPEEIQALLAEDNFFPAYHMNKKCWITLPLDDSLSDETVLLYVTKSHDIVALKKK